MAKYRKKPIIVEAVQYTEYGKLVKGMCNSISCYSSGNTDPHVHTVHNNQIVRLAVGDYVIKESDGEHYYPCKPDIFEATYEPVNIETSGPKFDGRFCCHLDCPNPAEWVITYGPTLDDYTESCTRHLGEMMTDALEHFVYPIPLEKTE